MRHTTIVLLTFLASLSGSLNAAPVELGDADARWRIDPKTMALEYQASGETILLSSPATEPFSFTDLEQGPEAVSWRMPQNGLSISCEVSADGAFELTAETDAETAALDWPNMELAPSGTLLWPRDSGLSLPMNDSFWRTELMDSEWDTLERLSMPIWGINEGDRCITWMVSTPFRNTVTFSETGKNDSLDLRFSHDFAAKSPERRITIRVVIDAESTPVTPALRYREWYEQAHHVTTLTEKAKAVPAVERLLGAPHIYLWGDAPFSWMDVHPKQWKPLCEKLLAEAEQKDSIAGRIKKSMSEERWGQVVECTKEEWPNRYMKGAIAAGLAQALSTAALEPGQVQPTSESLTRQSGLLADAFPGAFLPPDQWGNGVSLKMLSGLAEMGFDRLRLCIDGWEGIALRPQVAEDAARRGWLFGVYDSYHSIHNPDAKESELTWATAQMTPELWETGCIQRADGSYIQGFKGIGRKLSPIVARPYMEQRVSGVLDAVPLNYYFIDCDAFGEVYDDFNPLHPNSKEDGAEQRVDRLQWLSSGKNLVVGSEGGQVYAIEGAHVFEGLLGPHFGWGDEDLKDPKSEYFRGRYYPPEQPGIYFKPTSLKEKFRKLHYDPTVRIPLFQAAFHDAAMTTHHWSNGRFKYPEITPTVDLLEILWMSPPMAHLNYDTLKKRGPSLKEHLDRWAPLHKKLGFARMTGFRYLTADRLVQETTWTDGTRILANFGTAPFRNGETEIQPGDFATY